MTLESIPEYDESKASNRGERAVVVGAGVAGLCTARALADYFDAVTILDTDTIPDSPEPRRGVPQSRHPHMLRLGGAHAIDEYLPGFADDVLAAGGVDVTVGRDFNAHAMGGYWAGPATQYTLASASRPLFEHVLRRRVADFDDVQLRTGARCLGYVTDENTEVRGVRVRTADAEEGTVTAELVVDATGRTTRTPAWLDDHGYASPPVEEVQVDVAYSTAVVERPPADARTFVILPSSEGRAALVIPVENAQWMVTLVGRGDDIPPTDPEEFVAFADGLPVSVVCDLLQEHEWQSEDIEHYPFPSNRRYRYEELDRFPGGLAVIGDAIASFNPTYAQGMSVAAMEAGLLHDVLAETGVDGVGKQLVDRAVPVHDAPWFLTVAFDGLFPETSGPMPPGVDTYREFMAHLGSVIHDDSRVAEAMLRVSELEKPPSSLLDPGVLRRVFGTEETDRQAVQSPDWVSSDVSAAWPVIDEQLTSANDVRFWPGFTGETPTEIEHE